MKNAAFIVISALLVAVCLVLAYFLYRYVGYHILYEDMVRETIREMVKQEALR